MITIDNSKCIQCEKCLENCLMQAIKKTPDQTIAGPQKCLECGQCVAICPVNAVTMEGYDMQEVLDLPDTPILKTEDVLLAIKGRRSIRHYKEGKLTAEQIHVLLEAMRYTATGSNKQESVFVFIQDEMEECKKRTWNFIEKRISEGAAETDPVMRAYDSFLSRVKADASDDYLHRNAPMIVLIAADFIWDAGLEAQNLEHAAASMGLGVLYNGFLARIINQNEDMKKWLGIEGKNIAAAMLVGKPDVQFLRTVPRRPAHVIYK